MSLDLSNSINPTYNHTREEKLVTMLLNELGHEHFRPGLERLSPYFQSYQNLFQAKKIITIGGTNGKGETCYCLYDMLKSAGKRVALWTSPHILSLRERFILPDGPVSYELLEKIIAQTFEKVDGRKLSYYEFLFLVFCELVAISDVDIIIFEVGLGGRFDAVNLFDANLSAITSISRDHEEILGRGLKKILFEKFGIARANRVLVTALELKSVRDNCQTLALEGKVLWRDLFIEKKLVAKDDYRRRNLILAKELAALALEVVPEDVKINEIKMKGRFEKMTMGNISFIFVGAHNLDGMRKMRDFLSQRPPENGAELLMSFSKRSEKDILSCLSVWRTSQAFTKMHVTTFDHFKSAAKDLKSIWSGGRLVEGADQRMTWCEDWKDYLIEKPLEQRIDIYITGSYYFIGEVQRFLLSHPRFYKS